MCIDSTIWRVRLKEFIKSVFRFAVRTQPLKAFIEKYQYNQWVRSGKPTPVPHIAKQKLLKGLRQKHNLQYFVETGTFMGDMIEAMKEDFTALFSIELSKELYQKACRRFAGDKKVTLIEGDSGIELNKLIAAIDKPALFWLDGHYSSGITARGEKDTPVLNELKAVFSVKDNRHVVVIDDARCFGTDADYPSLEAVFEYVRNEMPEMHVYLENDAIVICPQV